MIRVSVSVSVSVRVRVRVGVRVRVRVKRYTRLAPNTYTNTGHCEPNQWALVQPKIPQSKGIWYTRRFRTIYCI